MRRTVDFRGLSPASMMGITLSYVHHHGAAVKNLFRRIFAPYLVHNSLAFPVPGEQTMYYHLDPVQGPAGGRFRELLPLPIPEARFLISGTNQTSTKFAGSYRDMDETKRLRGNAAASRNPYFSRAPRGTSSRKPARTGLPSGGREAARSMPLDSSPRILRGARLATITILRPISFSGS